MRNKVKDAAEMTQRRAAILTAGFELFSQRAIEAVSMQEVAAGSGVGIATLYRYFPTKLDLVIAVSAQQWESVYTELTEAIEKSGVLDKTAAEMFDCFLGCFIYLYKNHAPLLRFNYDFSHYVANAGVTREQLEANSKAMRAFSGIFHKVWERAQSDGTLRGDLSENELFSSVMHIMLAVSTRYAAGLVYHATGPDDDLKELETLKRMILNEYAVKS